MNIHHIAVYLHRYDLKMKKNTMALPALQRRIILHRFYSITINYKIVMVFRWMISSNSLQYICQKDRQWKLFSRFKNYSFLDIFSIIDTRFRKLSHVKGSGQAVQFPINLGFNQQESIWFHRRIELQVQVRYSSLKVKMAPNPY